MFASILVTVLGLMVLAVAACNLVLGLRLTARVKLRNRAFRMSDPRRPLMAAGALRRYRAML